MSLRCTAEARASSTLRGRDIRRHTPGFWQVFFFVGLEPNSRARPDLYTPGDLRLFAANEPDIGMIYDDDAHWHPSHILRNQIVITEVRPLRFPLCNLDPRPYLRVIRAASEASGTYRVFNVLPCGFS